MTRVLVVEDSEAMVELLVTVLMLEHFEVVAVRRRFARLLNRDDLAWEGIDVLICDLMLGEQCDYPRISGVDVLRAALEDHPHIKRIALTALTHGPLADEARRLATVLPKPSLFDEIVEAIEK